MIAVAARSTRGVVVPTGKATRAYIIKLFKKNLTHLRQRINVSELGISLNSSWMMIVEQEDWPRFSDL